MLGWEVHKHDWSHVLLGVCCGLNHRHGLGGRGDRVHGMRCEEILDGIERGSMHRLWCGLDHEHRHQRRRELVY